MALYRLFIISIAFLLCAASCMPRKTLSWNEEVQLQDGSVIWIKRSEFFNPSEGRELGSVAGSLGMHLGARIELKWQQKNLIWEALLTPIILQIDHGAPVVVATIVNCNQYDRMRRPRNAYVAFRYGQGGWSEVDVEHLQFLKDANLLVNWEGFGKRTTVSQSRELNAQTKVSKSFLKVYLNARPCD